MNEVLGKLSELKQERVLKLAKPKALQIIDEQIYLINDIINLREKIDSLVPNNQVNSA